jgi:hypothetical protein
MDCRVYYHRIGDVLRKDCVISGNIFHTIPHYPPNVYPIKPAQQFGSIMAFARTPQQKAYAAVRGPGELRQLRGIAYGWTEFRRRNHMSVI